LESEGFCVLNQNKFMRYLQGPLMYLVLLAVILMLVNMFGSAPRDNITRLDYTDLLKLIEKDGISNTMLTGNILVARKSDSQIPETEFGTRYDIITVLSDSQQRFYSDVNAIYANRLGKSVDEVSSADYAFKIRNENPAGTPWWMEWVPLLVTMGLFGAFWYFMMRQQTGSGKGGVMSFGKSRARLSDPSKNKVTFNEVAGADEEKEELREIVEFLKDPKRFTDVGARIPKGVLLVGPPGTGKTLLARAVSGEAGVPFFTISGSDFVEMFVGVGASRVRDLFDQAKKAAPAIVFIDEIDAVGRQRGAGLGGGHDEREQTLNQLLVEMDGFSHNEGVIVMAATNRADILDPALLRPGRFDRQVTVNYPDVKGREEILRIHSRGKPVDPSVDLEILARRTPYFTGADLENVMNEGAILTARAGKKTITMDILEEAITKVSAGPEKKSHKVTEEDKRLVAYHEAGHAIVMHHIPECDNVHEISIIPRSRGMGGYTMFLPEKEINYISSARLLAQMSGMMGGHCAERLVLGDVSTGSTSDLKRATQIARSMVTEYGMSEKLGPIFLGGDHQVFLGRDFSQTRSTFSEDVNAQVDSEVKRLLEASYERATIILKAHRQKLDNLATALIQREKVDREEFLKIIGAQPDGEAGSADIAPGAAPAF
jgi:cell division protease FtsH